MEQIALVGPLKDPVQPIVDSADVWLLVGEYPWTLIPDDLLSLIINGLDFFLVENDPGLIYQPIHFRVAVHSAFHGL